MNFPPESWQRFWSPKVDTPENAASAAKNGGVAFGFIALGFAVITLRSLWAHSWIPYREMLLENRRILSDPHPPLGSTILLDPQALLHYHLYDLLPLVIILLIAAYLAWRTYKRPSLLLCTTALVWVLLRIGRRGNRERPNAAVTKNCACSDSTHNPESGANNGAGSAT